MTLAGPILVTMVVGVALFLVPGLLSPETKGKVLAGELRNLGKKPAVSDRDIIVLGRIGAHGLGGSNQGSGRRVLPASSGEGCRRV